MDKVGIIGLGRAGTVLAYSMARLGFAVVVGRREPAAPDTAIKERVFPVMRYERLIQETEVLFITTPDAAIRTVADEIGGLLAGGARAKLKAVLHVSGSLPASVLHPLSGCGIRIGALHPLQSLAELDEALANLPGTFFAFDGDHALLPWIERLVGRLGGTLKVLNSPGDKTYYHLGACLVSNYLVALAHMGMACLQRAGFDRDDARTALLPLMRGTLRNLSAAGPEKALTGPVARGDLPTLVHHVRALAQGMPEFMPSYTALGRVTASLALAAGYLDGQSYAEINEIFEGGGQVDDDEHPRPERKKAPVEKNRDDRGL